MDRDSILEGVAARLNSSEFLAKRTAFQDRFSDQFESVFQEAEGILARLRLSDRPLPLFVLDNFPLALTSQLQDLSAAEKGAVAKELVARSLIQLPRFIEQAGLPDSIVQCYPTAVGYMTASIINDNDASYAEGIDSFFDRDLRMASGLTLPAGAQIVDLRVWLPRTFYRYRGLKKNLRCLSFLAFRLGGLGPLLRIHTDTRNLLEFNPPGFSDCYCRVAELLQLMPAVRGMVSTGWFFDPAIEQISPRLQYIRRVPLAGGAFVRIDGPDALDTRHALARSATRRKLYEEGKYKPICGTMVWPRKELIRWSEERRRAFSAATTRPQCV